MKRVRLWESRNLNVYRYMCAQMYLVPIPCDSKSVLMIWISVDICMCICNCFMFSLACGLIDVPWRRSKGAPGDDVTALATAVKAVMEKYGVSSLATADSTVIQPQRRLGNLFMALQRVQLTAARAAALICLPPPYRVALELQLLSALELPLEVAPVLLE